jgi:hypothetical protein
MVEEGPFGGGTERREEDEAEVEVWVLAVVEEGPAGGCWFGLEEEEFGFVNEEAAAEA